MSASVSATDIWISLVVFYLLFAVLGVADGWLMIRFGRRSIGDDPLAKITSEGGTDPEGPDTTTSPDTEAASSDDEPALVY